MHRHNHLTCPMYMYFTHTYIYTCTCLLTLLNADMAVCIILGLPYIMHCIWLEVCVLRKSSAMPSQHCQTTLIVCVIVWRSATSGMVLPASALPTPLVCWPGHCTLGGSALYYYETYCMRTLYVLSGQLLPMYVHCTHMYMYVLWAFCCCYMVLWVYCYWPSLCQLYMCWVRVTLSNMGETSCTHNGSACPSYMYM